MFPWNKLTEIPEDKLAYCGECDDFEDGKCFYVNECLPYEGNLFEPKKGVVDGV